MNIDETASVYETKSGHPVRIICTDRQDECPIVALVMIDGNEIIMSYTNDLIPGHEIFDHSMRLVEKHQ